MLIERPNIFKNFILFLITVMTIFSTRSCKGQDSPEPKDVSYRPATVAGSFYPSDQETLRKMVEGYLDVSSPVKINKKIIGIIAPHAGYIFSGKVAGSAYREVHNQEYDAIIVIAPSHQKAFRGASIFDGDAYTTPLGIVRVDKVLAKEVSLDNDLVKLSRDGHSWTEGNPEHSLEVQLPFIQISLPNTPIVPIVMGSQDFQTADALMRAIVNAVKKQNKNVLLVASTDLSHFHNINIAKSLDSNIIEDFSRFDYFKLAYYLFSHQWEACGGGPVVVVMMAAEQLGATKAINLEYATSGDVPAGARNKDSVVGYMSGVLIIDEEQTKDKLPILTEEEKKYLINLAEQSVKNTITNKKASIIPKESQPLLEKYAAFVTITKYGDLRACMGHTFATEPLVKEIENSASMASTQDYRFGPIEPKELKDLQYEISILSRMRRILNFNEIEIGKHGLYIRYGRNSGLLLPQVASERKWDVETFLKNTCLKAGLPSDTYLKPEAELYVFTALIIH